MATDGNYYLNSGSYMYPTPQDTWTTTDSTVIDWRYVVDGQGSFLERHKITLKCSKCGKDLGEIFGYGGFGDILCKTCHLLERLKE